MKQLGVKDFLTDMPREVRIKLAAEIRRIGTPEARAVHADALKAIEELDRERIRRAGAA